MIRFFVLILFVLAAIYAWMHADDAMNKSDEYIINGVSIESPHFVTTSAHIASVDSIHANWVAIIPYAFSRQGEPQVYFDHQRQWWGERSDGCAEMVRQAHEVGLKVMVKPHVWMHHDWIGEFLLTEEEEWSEWEQQYEAYILTFARLSDSLGVELFCIGTEYKLAVKYRPEFWSALIRKIRAVYSGKLTYAANWDSYSNVPFWSELDFIGVDAYFPLVDQSSASVNELISAWQLIKDDLANLSTRERRPILFAEFGYQSVNGAAGNHWEVEQSMDNLNEQLQADAYESVFQSFWKEDWFAGGFLWKWHLGERAGKRNALSFTPQGKKAENVIRKWYQSSGSQ